MLLLITSAAGLPPYEIHSSSISRPSVVTINSPCTIFGGSGGTSTVKVAKRDRMPGVPAKFNAHGYYYYCYCSIS